LSSERGEGLASSHSLRERNSETRGSTHGVKARVFLLSDVRLYREGLLWSLARQPAFEVLEAADLSKAALARLAVLRPDVIILDVGAPDSFALAKSLGISLPNTKIVAFAVSEIDHLVLACAEAGIAGYVAPDGSEEDLVTAIEYALRGELYCSPRIAGLLLRRVTALSSQPEKAAEPGSLTQRERQVLALMGEGMSNKEIGRALRIGDSTVKNHVHNILEKLQVHRRGEAAVRLRAMHVASGGDPLERRHRADGASSHG
jgi:two-component system, NarL family, nitrate/nitrite response regulator NarL